MGFKPVIPVEAAPAEMVEMTASSDSHRIQAENVELDDIPVEAPPAKRLKMMDSSGSYGIQAEIVGRYDIQVETAAPAETVEMAASNTYPILDDSEFNSFLAEFALSLISVSDVSHLFQELGLIQQY